MSNRDEAFDRMSRTLATRRGALRMLGGGVLTGFAAVLVPGRARAAVGSTAVGPGTCAHNKCVTGAKLDPTCDPCVALVCATDPYCCTYEWDSACVNAVKTTCGERCGESICANTTSTCVHDKCTTGRPLLATCDPCVKKVCAWDDSCCNQVLGHWDEVCIGYVHSQCGCTCP